jgi:predicted Rdx family selenoprotein
MAKTRQRTESGVCPGCGARASVAVTETSYAWLVADRYESTCPGCGAALVWRFKDVGDWSAWAPVSRDCRIRLRDAADPERDGGHDRERRLI